MKKAMLHEIHPILPVKDVTEALKYYVNKVRLKISFGFPQKTTFINKKGSLCKVL